MPYFAYDITKGTAGNFTLTGSNTEDPLYFAAAGSSCPVQLGAVYATGKGSAVSQLSGCAIRVAVFTTASTSGTSITPNPKGSRAAVHTAASGGTLGSGRTNRVLTGCGHTVPGGWVAPNSDALVRIEGGSGDSIDVIAATPLASLPIEASCETWE